MSALPGYDHWKTTDPAEGASEAMEAITQRLMDDERFMAGVDEDIACDAAEWVAVLADASYALRMAQHGATDYVFWRRQLTELAALAKRIRDKRDEAVSEEALREFNKGEDC